MTYFLHLYFDQQTEMEKKYKASFSSRTLINVRICKLVRQPIRNPETSSHQYINTHFLRSQLYQAFPSLGESRKLVQCDQVPYWLHTRTFYWIQSITVTAQTPKQTELGGENRICNYIYMQGVRIDSIVQHHSICRSIVEPRLDCEGRAQEYQGKVPSCNQSGPASCLLVNLALTS